MPVKDNPMTIAHSSHFSPEPHDSTAHRNFCRYHERLNKVLRRKWRSVLGEIRTGGLDAAETGAGGGVPSVQLQNEVVFVKGQAIVAARGGCIRLAQQFGNVATAETIYFDCRSFAGRLFDRLF